MFVNILLITFLNKPELIFENSQMVRHFTLIIQFNITHLFALR